MTLLSLHILPQLHNGSFPWAAVVQDKSAPVWRICAPLPEAAPPSPTYFCVLRIVFSTFFTLLLLLSWAVFCPLLSTLPPRHHPHLGWGVASAEAGCGWVGSGWNRLCPARGSSSLSSWWPLQPPLSVPANLHPVHHLLLKNYLKTVRYAMKWCHLICHMEQRFTQKLSHIMKG